MPFGLGIGELLVIVLVLGLVFGAKRLPLLARGLGHGIRNFKGALKAPDDEEADPPDDG